MLIVNCSRLDWALAVKWFIDSAHAEEGGFAARRSKVLTYDDTTREVSIDPSYGPENGPYAFVDGSAVRCTVDIIIYSPVISRQDWLGETTSQQLSRWRTCFTLAGSCLYSRFVASLSI